MKRIRATPVVAAVLLLTTDAGCALPRTGMPVDPLDRVSHVMTSAGALEIRDYDFPGQGVIREAVVPGRNQRPIPPNRRSDGSQGHDLLALSGGGSNGAFGAGVLFGWTQSGSRPTFQVVTGISTGSLLASYAFAGPPFDDRMRANFTTIANSQIFRRNSIFRLFRSDSLCRTEPLHNLLTSNVDAALLDAVAAGDRDGRRLYVGSTHLDHKRLVIWDMGSIAASGHAGAAELYGKVLLASCSIPVMFNPVEFQVLCDGGTYSELHVDGGARSQVFMRRPLLENLEGTRPKSRKTKSLPDDSELLDETPRKPKYPDLSGSRLYIIVNGKLRADPSAAKRELFLIARDSVNSLMYAHANGDIYRLFYLTDRTGMEFRLLPIPQDATVPSSAEFSPPAMWQLFNLGVELSRGGLPWMSAPRGVEEDPEDPRSLGDLNDDPSAVANESQAPITTQPRSQ